MGATISLATTTGPTNLPTTTGSTNMATTSGTTSLATTTLVRRTAPLSGSLDRTRFTPNSPVLRNRIRFPTVNQRSCEATTTFIVTAERNIAMLEETGNTTTPIMALKIRHTAMMAEGRNTAILAETRNTTMLAEIMAPIRNTAMMAD